MLDKVISALSVLFILSVTAERIVQVLKVVPIFSRLLQTEDVRKKQLVAVIVGTTVGYMEVPVFVQELISNQYLAYLVTGMLISAGSGIWHDLLKILQDCKTDLAAVKTT